MDAGLSAVNERGVFHIPMETWHILLFIGILGGGGFLLALMLQRHQRVRIKSGIEVKAVVVGYHEIVRRRGWYAPIYKYTVEGEEIVTYGYITRPVVPRLVVGSAVRIVCDRKRPKKIFEVDDFEARKNYLR